MRYRLGAVALCVLSSAFSAFAADVTPGEEVNRFLKARQTISNMGPTPFGEQVNLYTGELSFEQADLQLPGTGPDIAIVRSTRTSQDPSLQLGDGVVAAAFGSWDLVLPRIETLVMTPSKTVLGTPGENWKADASGANTYNRCSYTPMPWNAMENWWRGIDLIGPGGHQSLLKRVPENQQAPNNQPATYPLLTEQNWQISCLPNTANVNPVEPGEAFLAIAPDGTKYTFNYLTGIRAGTVVENDYSTGKLVRIFTGRMLARMYATRVEDRFGNYVTYQYTGDKIQRIDASDGRAVQFTWRTDIPVISSIAVLSGTTVLQTWNYGYTGSVLTTVTQPDNSAWTFSGDLSYTNSLADSQLTECGRRSGLASQTGTTVTITAPSGLTGSFTRQGVWHSRSYVPSVCLSESTEPPHEGNPPLFGTWSLVSRTISGPGVPAQTWSYAYSPQQGSTDHDACAASNTCIDRAYVDVTDPSGSLTRHTFSNRWGVSDGQVVQIDYYQGSATLLRTETRAYAPYNLGPYPTRRGALVAIGFTNAEKTERISPVRESVVIQQGRSFKSYVDTYNVYAAPTRVIRSSTPAP